MSQTTTPLIDPQYAIRPTLPSIVWDYEGTVAWAKAQVEKYQGLVVTADQVADIKAIMADINKRKIALDNARKLTRKQLLNPLDAWDAQVKSVLRIFDETYAGLSAQVKAFVEAERESRRASVQAIIDEVMAAHDIKPFAIPIDEKWLNKTTTQKAIRESVTEIIASHIEQEKAAQMQEQALAERRALIEQCVLGDNKSYPGIKLSVAECMTPKLMDLSMSAADVSAAIHRRAEKLHENAKLLSTMAEGAKADDEREQPRQDVQKCASEAQEEEKALTIIITYSASRSEAVKSLAMQLKILCTTFSVRKTGEGL